MSARKASSRCSKSLSWSGASDCRRHSGNNKRTIPDSAEVNEADRVLEISCHPVGDGDGHSRFANAARSHDADKPPGLDLREQRFDGLIAANHPLQARRVRSKF